MFFHYHRWNFFSFWANVYHKCIRSNFQSKRNVEKSNISKIEKQQQRKPFTFQVYLTWNRCMSRLGFCTIPSSPGIVEKPGDCCNKDEFKSSTSSAYNEHLWAYVRETAFHKNHHCPKRLLNTLISIKKIWAHTRATSVCQSFYENIKSLKHWQLYFFISFKWKKNQFIDILLEFSRHFKLSYYMKYTSRVLVPPFANLHFMNQWWHFHNLNSSAKN